MGGATKKNAPRSPSSLLPKVTITVGRSATMGGRRSRSPPSISCEICRVRKSLLSPRPSTLNKKSLFCSGVVVVAVLGRGQNAKSENANLLRFCRAVPERKQGGSTELFLLLYAGPRYGLHPTSKFKVKMGLLTLRRLANFIPKQKGWVGRAMGKRSGSFRFHFAARPTVPKWVGVGGKNPHSYPFFSKARENRICKRGTFSVCHRAARMGREKTCVRPRAIFLRLCGG